MPHEHNTRTMFLIHSKVRFTYEFISMHIINMNHLCVNGKKVPVKLHTYILDKLVQINNTFVEKLIRSLGRIS